MSIVLYHHSHTRAANVVWMLEELGVPYTLVHLSLHKGEQKTPEMLAKTPGEILYFGLYYTMTGLHALHVVIGVIVLLFMIRSCQITS